MVHKHNNVFTKNVLEYGTSVIGVSLLGCYNVIL